MNVERALRVWLAGVVLSLAATRVSAADGPADICLEAVSGTFHEGEWSTLEVATAESVGSRPALFPQPVVRLAGSRLDIHAGHEGLAHGDDGCLEPGYDWTARYDRDFLQAGAERMLAEAPTTPGIESSVLIEWHPIESRLRTLLEFSGPFDIPYGRCWIDDVLSVDESAGAVVASGARGLETSPFAESACERFYGHLPDGGAGEQAVTLLPDQVAGLDGSPVRLVATSVSVRDDAIVVSGRLERARP